jgi:hypothetical protein
MAEDATHRLTFEWENGYSIYKPHLQLYGQLARTSGALCETGGEISGSLNVTAVKDPNNKLANNLRIE